MSCHFTSSFLPFPDDYISGNLAPLVEEQDTSPTLFAAFGARPGHGTETGESGFAPPKKRQRVGYTCEVCHTTYTQQRALARHRQTDRHRQNAGLPPATKYHCTRCSAGFSRDHDRVRHERETHDGIKRGNDGGRALQGHDCAPENSMSSGSDDPYSLRMKCEQEQSFIIEDDVDTSCHGWDTLSVQMEVHPGPANRSATVSCSESLDRSKALLESARDGRARLNSKGDDSWSCADTSRGCESRTTSPAETHTGTWFDDGDSDLDDTPLRIQLSLKSGPSSAADSAVDMTEDKLEHEPKRPSITTMDYRSEFDDEKIAISNASTEDSARTEATTSPEPILQAPARVTVIQRRGKATTIPSHQQLICIICNQAFEHDHQSLLPHLRQHLAMLRGDQASFCAQCKVWFTNKADLHAHLVTADVMKHCGIGFPHTKVCTGHHPPDADHFGDEKLSDRDSFLLCSHLRLWEHKQLCAYISEVRELVATHNSRASACYSVEALFKKTRDSFSSHAISVNTYHSAPCDAATNAQLDVGGLRQRLQQMSLKGTGQMRHTAKKLPHILRAGGSLNKALHTSAKASNLTEVERLVKLGASPSAIVGEQSVLSAAAQFASLETTQLLVGLGADVNGPDNKYGCALSSAAHDGKLDVVDFLLRQGADPNQIGGKYGSPLGTVAGRCYVEVADRLLRHHADPSGPGGVFGCPLSNAAASGSTEMVRLLLQHGAAVNQAGGDEGSPLGHAVWYNRMNLVDLLLESGADPNANDGRHGSVLQSAITGMVRGHGSEAIVSLLLDRRADVNRESFLGSALQTAASHADVAAMSLLIKLLISNGADVNARGPNGTALQLAKKRRHYWMDQKPFTWSYPQEALDDVIGYCYDVVRLLKEAGATDEESRSSSSMSRRKQEAGLSSRTPSLYPLFVV